MQDFPAAHSMDTTWFAVDARGRVVQFDSGEDGAVPKNAASAGGAGEASFDTELLGDKLPIEFSRDHGDDPGLYTRVQAPADPLLISDLPEQIRGHVKGLELPVDLVEQDTVHLADHIAEEDAFLWGDDWSLRDFGPPGPPPSARVVQAKPTSRVAIAVVAAIVVGIIAAILR